MKKLISHIFLYLTLASATLAFPAPTLPPVDFFAARAFGGNNVMYYDTQPGDFDGDGRPDVITSSATALYVFFGDGSGDYSADPLILYTYSSNEYVFTEIGDYNNDGRDDAAFLRTNPQTLMPSIAVYFGNADRTFAEPVFSAVTPRAQSLHRVDWDLDGKLDLLGKADGTGVSLLVFYKGSGTGDFTTTTQLSLTREPGTIGTGDFNADGRPDAVITDSDGLKVSQNMPDASFGPAATVDTIDFGFKTAAVADLNNDGRSDIVATEGITSSPIAAVWLATGNMAFVHAGDISLGNNTNANVAALADVTGDGLRDALVAAHNRTVIRPGAGNGTFGTPLTYIEGGGGSLFVRDMNTDSLPDIVASQSIEFAVAGSGSFVVMKNLGQGNFRSGFGLRLAAGTKDIAVSNLNADQLKDFVIVSRGSGGGPGEITILFQSAGAAVADKHAEPEMLSIGSTGVDFYAVTTGDFTSDGRNDIIAVGHGAFGAAQNAVRLTNNGNNTFSQSLIQVGTGDIYDVASADLNGDGKLDLVTTGYDGVLVSFGVGNGSFGTPVPYLQTIASSKIAIADFNNDTRADIAVLNYNIGRIAVLINNGTGGFTNPTTLVLPGGILDIAAADMNADGNADLVAAKGNGVAVMAGAGNGSFDAEQRFSMRQGPAAGLTVADFNGDQRPDVAAMTGRNTVSVLLNNGFGALGRETLWGGGVEMMTLAASDLDNDGRNDILAGFTTSTDGYLKFYFNTTVPQAPTVRAPFDFDGDGKTDVGIYRPNGGSGGEWWYLRSSDAGTRAFGFGISTDNITPADYTGDGKTDVAIWRPSTGFWYVMRSEDNTFYGFPFGADGDVPVPGDYDADGKADPAVFRSGTWYILQSSTDSTRVDALGTAGDRPVNADYDGDGKSDVAIYRPTGGSGAGEWWINMSTQGLRAIAFGTAGDKTVPGDYTGDGKADVAIFRPSTGFWYIVRSEDLSFYGFPFGADGDVPASGDYDGDGKFDPAVFRSGTWYINRSTAGQQIVGFGTAGDTPVASAFVR